jgi:hypothetical protein
MTSYAETVLFLLNLGLTLSMFALAVAWWRDQRAERIESDRRAASLADRVTRLEGQATAHRMRIDSTKSHDDSRGVARPRTGQATLPEPTLISVPNLAAGGIEQGASVITSSELGRRFGAIWEQADAGADAEAIARATGQLIGQVELILGLKRQLEAATSGSPERK